MSLHLRHMDIKVNPYDELPYRALPIEWTAPERLALTSLLHGGPRGLLQGYRVLELGCADGANLLPLAYHRRHATFVGVDGAGSQIDIGSARCKSLGLSNVELVHADFTAADAALSGRFDYIIAHGIFSWVPDDTRDAMLALCAHRLAPGGLLYLNYNAKPGWNVRGLVRDYLMAQTMHRSALLERAHEAQHVARQMAVSAAGSEHPYSRLIADELRFVCENDVSYVAHEYLAADNHAYWRREFIELMGQHSFGYVADADFNYSTGRVSTDMTSRLTDQGFEGCALDETTDFLSYRQLHSPIMTTSPMDRRLPHETELAELYVAACLLPAGEDANHHAMFQHPSGWQVEAREAVIADALGKLRLLWPRGVRVGTLFADVGDVIEDLRMLHANGLIELRCVEPSVDGFNPMPPCRSERGIDYIVTPYHTREAYDPESGLLVA